MCQYDCSVIMSMWLILYHVPHNLEMKGTQAEENNFCGEFKVSLGSSPDPVGDPDCASLVSPLRNGTLPITTGVSIVGEGNSQDEACVTHRLTE